MKTIFITASYKRIVRNIFRTDVLKTLKSKDLRIVILSPGSKEEYFRKEFQGPKVILEDLPACPRKKLEMLLAGIRKHYT